MDSNYVKSAHIKIKQHPEWNLEQKYKEIEKAYNKEGYQCYYTDGCLWLMPYDDDKPVTMIYGVR